MDLNASKCSLIHILPSKRKHIIDSSYTLHGQTLETVEESKYLGVTISNNLTWTRHTENFTGKGNKTFGFLRRNFKDCTTQVKAVTYTTMVQPTLEYATSVWDPYLQKDIKAVEQVQRRAAHYVLNDYSTRTPGCVTGMVNKLQWESLETRRNDRLTMLYRIQHGLVDVHPDSYLQQSRGTSSLPRKNWDRDLQLFLLPKNNQGLEHATIWDSISADTGGNRANPGSSY